MRWVSRYLKNFSVFSFSLFLCTGGFGWSTLNGVAISTAISDQSAPQLVSDSAGGSIIAWTDSRNGFDTDIYAQRVNSSGSTLWTLNGVPICAASGGQLSQQIVTDGSGGAIIAWQDNRGSNSAVYAQRVNSSGSTLWALNGLAISTSTVNLTVPGMLSDGIGGAFLVWSDSRSGTSLVYAQRINSSGSSLWTLNGIAIASTNSSQLLPVMVSDGSGGIIVAFEQYDFTSRIYATRLNSNGSTLWASDTLLAPGGYGQDRPTIVSDGSGGAIVSWQDTRNLGGAGSDIYAQRVDLNGNTLWSSNGVVISTTQFNKIDPIAVTDTAGGAIITWEDYRNTTTNINSGIDLYAQRVNSAGSTLWTFNGVAVCTTLNDQINQAIAADSSGGAFITWQDYRSTTSAPLLGADIYVQHLNSNGSTLFALNGNPYCTASSGQVTPQIINDGFGGAILTWADFRNGSDYDVYAQSFNSSGAVPVELSIFEAIESIKE